ncbi:hypothetical protein V2J09_016700 [Rumex salicifolius]
MMRPRPQKSRNVQGKGPNWMLVAGGALISSLSIHIGYKLKNAFDSKRQDKVTPRGDRRQAGIHHSRPIEYPYVPDEGRCFNFNSGSEGTVEIKNHQNSQILSEQEVSLSLVTVSAPEYHHENGNVWVSSPEHTELPPKRFHHSNCSDSPCASDSGSDVFSKREVIQKLRQQLKRRDNLVLEMQDQIMELQIAINSQVSHSNHLQSQLDARNRELFDSERKIQRLRKAIADHCVGHVECNEKNSTTSTTIWSSEGNNNGCANGYPDGSCKFPDKSSADGEKIEMLKREIGELKDVIKGKEFLMQSYKEQKSELSFKIKELQLRLDSQLPNILALSEF